MTAAQAGNHSVIVGGRKKEPLVDNLGAAVIVLSSAEMARLDDVRAFNPDHPGYLPEIRRGDRVFGRLQSTDGVPKDTTPGN
ncbi:MAG: hypothetical protein KDK01_17140 [Rhodobacteraceae bacterium]|nr:hypothetical protein [Paracoccaceae bacterium]